MIVADTNLIAYLFIPGPFAADAEQVILTDSVWMAPPLWRSELLNVLCTYMRSGVLDYSQATQLFAKAKALMAGREVNAEPEQVLALAAASGCASYDCEFVALAQRLGVPVVTADRKVLAAFPSTAVSLREFVAATGT